MVPLLRGAKGVVDLAKVKIYELAKQIDVERKEIIKKLQKMGVDAKNHRSAISQKAVSYTHLDSYFGRARAGTDVGFGLSDCGRCSYAQERAGEPDPR